jgi:hypothetical protein
MYMYENETHYFVQIIYARETEDDYNSSNLGKEVIIHTQ